MNTYLSSFTLAKQELLNYFECKEDYHVKSCTSYSFKIEEREGVYFLTYWNKEKTPVVAVVVKKDGAPQIFRKNDLTMVVAIDCIKIAFILNNSGEK